MPIQFESLQEFWNMAGHGPYVWSAYLVFVLVFALLVGLPIMRHRRSLDRLAERERLASQRRDNSAQAPNA